MNKGKRTRRHWLVLVAALAVGLGATGIAGASSPFTTITTFEGPPFGLSNLSGKAFYASVGGAGPILVDGGSQSLVNSLPGVNDAVPAGGDKVLAVATEGGPGLYLVSPSSVEQLADIAAFEEAVDPAADGVETNPFDVERIGRLQAVVADAAGNSLLHVSNSGEIDWIASFPNEDVECLSFICEEPELVDADPVSTSVAIGPDGAYYVGELKGFPAAPGTSKVWRIEPGTRHAVCGESSACSVVGTGFTSVIDLAFGPKGKLYVVELDEAGWLAAEEGFGAGGTVNECTVGASLSCTERATGLYNPTAVAFNRSNLHATLIDFETFGGQLVSIP